MSLMSLRNEGKVAIISMDNGKNAHNLEFSKQLLALLKQVEEDKGNKALILASSDEKSWSQGIDVPWMMGNIQNGNHADVKEFLHNMDAIYTAIMEFPMPVIAAINGHTFGNGSVLACACDFRFMRCDRGFFCFPEVDMSIPFIPGLLDVILKVIPQYRFNEMLLSGRRLSGDELKEDKVVEQTFEGADALLEGALAYAKTFSKGRGIFAEHKRRFHKPAIEGLAIKNPPVIDAMKVLL
ncbi:MAG: enoyl-CoA hydratase/carnithine racemase [Oleispira sp.]|jgi:enoyl-CoA hydratase/carnithine racemase|tara:strand:+ start:713 stop:1429 length:717 start_codon:yes stop_codon:yes gene_type:complete